MIWRVDVGFLTSLFGGQNTWITVFFALGIVIILIFLVLWILKLVSNASAGTVRGRNRRLAIVDTTPIDPKRRLVLIRRDNVEHLLLIGGARELVVESAIPVAKTVRPRVTVNQGELPAATARRGEPDTIKPRTTMPPPATEPAATTPSEPNPIDRLRELKRPAKKRRSPSLRHTGLLRPVSIQEHSSFSLEDDKPAPGAPDSDKSSSSKGPAANKEPDQGESQDKHQPDKTSKAG